MTNFLDGPAAGVVLALSRAPRYLRVVHNPVESHRDGWDALDQLSDCPKSNETVYAYRMVGDYGSVHLDYTEKGKRKGKTLTTAEYEFIAEQPSQNILRDTTQWQTWVVCHNAANKQETGS